jgi:hypothetical protein
MVTQGGRVWSLLFLYGRVVKLGPLQKDYIRKALMQVGCYPKAQMERAIKIFRGQEVN